MTVTLERPRRYTGGILCSWLTPRSRSTPPSGTVFRSSRGSAGSACGTSWPGWRGPRPRKEELRKRYEETRAYVRGALPRQAVHRGGREGRREAVGRPGGRAHRGGPVDRGRRKSGPSGCRVPGSSSTTPPRSRSGGQQHRLAAGVDTETDPAQGVRARRSASPPPSSAAQGAGRARRRPARRHHRRARLRGASTVGKRCCRDGACRRDKGEADWSGTQCCTSPCPPWTGLAVGRPDRGCPICTRTCLRTDPQAPSSR